MVELVALMKKAGELTRARRAKRDEITGVVEALKENAYLRERLDPVRTHDEIRQLEEIRLQDRGLRRRFKELLERSQEVRRPAGGKGNPSSLSPSPG